MSVVGEKAAIFGLGISCQSAWQIKQHVALLRTLTADETLAETSLPFDWMSTPPSSAASLLSARDRFPERPEDMTMNRVPFWPAHGVHFFHDFLHNKHRPRHEAPIFRIDNYFDTTQQKFQRKWGRFGRLNRNARRLIAVVSNAQKNVVRNWRLLGNVSPILKVSELNKLKDTVQTVFGRPVEFVVVSCEDRCIADEEPIGFSVTMHTLDGSPWKGDPAQWAATFTRVLRRAP